MLLLKLYLCVCVFAAVGLAELQENPSDERIQLIEGNILEEIKGATDKANIENTCSGLDLRYQNRIAKLEQRQDFGPEELMQLNRVRDLLVTKCIDFLKYKLGSSMLVSHNSANTIDETELYLSMAKWMLIINEHVEMQLKKRAVDEKQVYDFLYPLLTDESSGATEPPKRSLFPWNERPLVDPRDILNPEINLKLKKSLKKSNIKSLSQKRAEKFGHGLCLALDHPNFKYIYRGLLSMLKYYRTNTNIKLLIQEGRREKVANLYSLMLISKTCKLLKDKAIKHSSSSSSDK